MKKILSLLLLSSIYGTANAGFTIKIEGEQNPIPSSPSKPYSSLQSSSEVLQNSTGGYHKDYNAPNINQNSTLSYTPLNGNVNVLNVLGVINEDYSVSGKGVNVPVHIALEAIKPKTKNKYNKKDMWTVVYGNEVNENVKNRSVTFEAGTHWIMVLEEILRQSSLKATISPDTKTVLINLHPEGNGLSVNQQKQNNPIPTVTEESKTHNPYQKFIPPVEKPTHIVANDNFVAKEIVLVSGKMYSEAIKEFLNANGYEMKWNYNFDFVIKNDSRVAFESKDGFEDTLKKLLMPLNLRPVLYQNGSSRPIYEIIAY